MHDTSPAISILGLEHPLDGTAGGKAAGLARLVRHGFPVPPGFVIVGLAPGEPLPPLVLEAYRALGGGAVAVRSSASGEDGAEASFAGQFESVLGVDGEVALNDAVQRCLRSLHGGRVAAYAAGRARPGAARMSVVVQRMVDARTAGVVFSVDPVSMRRDCVPVDAVSGLGESLVAGRAAPDHYETSRDGAVRLREPANGAPLLSDGEVASIARGAVDAERAWGTPLDLEWAVDREGRLWWLQARPITTPLGDLHEFDVHQGDTHVCARFNIGEMIPGALTPLTLTTTVRGIDDAIQRMLVRCGTRAAVTKRLHTVAVHRNHVFFSLTAILEFARQVAGVTRESMMHSICSRDVPELGEPAYAPGWVRTLNGGRYFAYVLGALVRADAHRRKTAGFRIATGVDAASSWRALDAGLPFLYETYDVHIQSSAGSGFGSGVIEGIIAKGKTPTPAQEAAAAGLIAGAGGVESADLLRQLEGVALRIVVRREQAVAFRGRTPAEALAWLRGADAGEAGRAFADFLAAHGHRAIRELELRQAGWADDPLPLVVSLQAMVGARLAGRPGRPLHATPPPPPGVDLNAAVRYFGRFARNAIRRREATKSLLVEVTDRFKRAYRRLSEQLVREGRLPDADLVFFLTHEELGRLAACRDGSLAERAALRRRVHELQEALEFPDVFVGRPEPVEPGASYCAGSEGLPGKPVCAGVAEGPARVIRSFDEAASIRPGEILIVPQSDVAWSPYYSVVAGLATDLGSPMSHGAVVAREYGLPSLTNLRHATRTFRTGERVRLDADRGVLLRLAPEAGEETSC
jgi:phosphohistidine swiveling domain-containing protein